MRNSIDNFMPRSGVPVFITLNPEKYLSEESEIE